MKRIRIIVVLALAVSASAWAASEADLVKYRQSGMKVLGGSMTQISAIVKGEVPREGELKAHADALAAQAKFVKAAYKDKAGGDKSHARPEIWQNWDDFSSKADDLETASAALAEAAGKGDRAAVRQQVAAVGKTCKSCHDKYEED